MTVYHSVKQYIDIRCLPLLESQYPGYTAIACMVFLYSPALLVVYSLYVPMKDGQGELT